jgi:hypothetical protein
MIFSGACLLTGSCFVFDRLRVPSFHFLTTSPTARLNDTTSLATVDQVERYQMRPSRGFHSLSVLLSTHFPHFMALEIGSGDLHDK